jgi:hypothetical protein
LSGRPQALAAGLMIDDCTPRNEVVSKTIVIGEIESQFESVCPTTRALWSGIIRAVEAMAKMNEVSMMSAEFQNRVRVS